MGTNLTDFAPPLAHLGAPLGLLGSILGILKPHGSICTSPKTISEPCWYQIWTMLAPKSPRLHLPWSTLTHQHSTGLAGLPKGLQFMMAHLIAMEYRLKPATDYVRDSFFNQCWAALLSILWPPSPHTRTISASAHLEKSRHDLFSSAYTCCAASLLKPMPPSPPPNLLQNSATSVS